MSFKFIISCHTFSNESFYNKMELFIRLSLVGCHTFSNESFYNTIVKFGSPEMWSCHTFSNESFYNQLVMCHDYLGNVVILSQMKASTTEAYAVKIGGKSCHTFSNESFYNSNPHVYRYIYRLSYFLK